MSLLLYMYQSKLFEIFEEKKIISMPHINMEIFSSNSDESPYKDGFLEINSNKFWIKLSFEEKTNNIDTFEIRAAKWYFDMDILLIKTLRNIVFNLYSQINKSEIYV